MATPEITTPREAALDFVRTHTGGACSTEEVEWFRRTAGGSYNDRYAVSLGGYLRLEPENSWEKPSKKRLDRNWVLVHRVNREYCSAAFRLSDLVDEIARVDHGQMTLELL